MMCDKILKRVLPFTLISVLAGWVQSQFTLDFKDIVNHSRKDVIRTLFPFWIKANVMRMTSLVNKMQILQIALPIYC